MKAIEAIRTRRSIRKYQDKPISEETMKELLSAAMCAPSAGNEQPWHFIVLRDRKLMEKIAGAHPHAGMLTKAAAAIVVCADEKLEKYKGFWPQDCSAATQNLLLAAHAMGLGGVWVGIHPNEDHIKLIRDFLKIPQNIIPFSLIPLGYPDESKSAESRFASDRVHSDRW